MEGRQGQTPVPGTLNPPAAPAGNRPRAAGTGNAPALSYRHRFRASSVQTSLDPLYQVNTSRYALIQILLACLLLPSIGIAAEAYKWTDENGRVHYGDKPPAEGAVPVEIDDEPGFEAAMEERREKRRRLLEIFDEDRQKRREEKDAARREREKRQQRCADARDYLREIRDAGFLYEETGDPDNPRILTAEERRAKTELMQKRVEKWCD